MGPQVVDRVIRVEETVKSAPRGPQTGKTFEQPLDSLIIHALHKFVLGFLRPFRDDRLGFGGYRDWAWGVPKPLKYVE